MEKHFQRMDQTMTDAKTPRPQFEPIDETEERPTDGLLAYVEYEQGIQFLLKEATQKANAAAVDSRKQNKLMASIDYGLNMRAVNATIKSVMEINWRAGESKIVQIYNAHLKAEERSAAAKVAAKAKPEATS
jgi:hypothetical protein